MRLQRRSGSTSQSSSSGGRRALVKWLDGPHTGKFTHNVHIEWFLNLDAPSPINGETYAIEWRVSPRPKCGWAVYDALVYETSSDLDHLQARLAELELAESRDDSGGTGSDGTGSDGTGSDGAGTSDMRRSPQLMDINSDAFRELVRALSRDRSPRRSRDHPQSSATPPPQSEEKVCVGKSLWVDKSVYTLASHASSPGRVIRPLLRQAFSRQRLCKSSYAGQRRVIDGKEILKPGLKKYQKMADIHSLVLKKFPHLSQAAFGAAVNGFLGERNNPVHQMEYVEDSESETEDLLDV